MKYALDASTAFMKNKHWMRVERNVHTAIWVYSSGDNMARLVEFNVASDEVMFCVMHAKTTEFFITLTEALKRIDAITADW